MISVDSVYLCTMYDYTCQMTIMEAREFKKLNIIPSKSVSCWGCNRTNKNIIDENLKSKERIHEMYILDLRCRFTCVLI